MKLPRKKPSPRSRKARGEGLEAGCAPNAERREPERTPQRPASRRKATEALTGRPEKAPSRANAYDRNLIDASLDPLVTIGPDGRITDVSAATETATGWSRGELIGTDFSDHFTEPEKARAGYQQVLRDGLMGDYPLELRHRDGHVTSVVCNASVYRDERGNVIGVFAAARDVTERQRAEKALRESEEQYRKLFEGALDAIIVASAETGTIIDCNRAATLLWGREKSELVGQHQRMLHPPEETEGGVSRTFQQHLREKEGQTLETQIVTKNGEIRGVEIMANVFELGGQRFIQGIFRDITERKRAEEALAAERNLLRMLMDSLPDRIYVKDVESRFLLNNIAHIHALGAQSQEEVTGKTDYDFRPPDLADRYFADDQHVIQSGEPLVNREEPTVLASGERGWLLVSKVPTRDPEGKITGLVGISRDITERKRAEEALRQEQTLFDSLASTIPDHIYFKDRQSRFVRINDSMAQRFGLRDPGAAVGQTDFDFFSEEHARQAYDDEQRVMRTGEPLIGLEEKETWPDGRVSWVSTTKVPLRDANGTITGLVGISRDITERRRAEEARKESESRLRSIIESSKDGIIFFNGETRKIVLGNGAMAELLGCADEDLIGRSIPSLHPSEKWEGIEQEFQKHVSGERSFSTGIPVLRNDGSVFYADISSSHVMLDGRSYFSAFFRDITERKQAELALSESETRFRMLFDSSADGILLTTPDGRILAANQSACRMLGRSEAQICEAGREGIVDVQDCNLPALLEERARAGMAKGELTYLRGDGSRFRAEVSSAIFETSEGPRTSMVIRDITERKRIEEALRESEERFRTLVEHAPDAVFVGTFQEAETFPRFAYVNAAAVELFGAASAAKLVGQPIMERIHPDYHAAVREDIHDLEEKESISATELIYLRVDGTPVPVELTVANIAFQGRAGALLFVRDITERKKTEEKIREQALLLETASDAIMVRDLQHRILYWNKSAERLYGWKAEEVLGREVPGLLFTDPGGLASAFEKVVKEGDWTGEVRHVTKALQEITVLSRWSLVRDDQGRPKSVFVINTDITERKKLEAQLYRAQRLESIGQLASGIAHDLNNILAPLVMVAPLLRMEIKTPETLRLVDILESNTKRGVEVVKQILTFSRGLKGGKGLVPPRPLLKEIVNVFDETFPKSITLQSSIPEDLWMVEGDVTQLHQVLMNLCVNARDAMPDGGTLTLAAENVVVDELYAGMSPGAKPGPYVVWLVADTGTGIPPENLDRIFDPFFTTKEPGKGTGLGLSTVLGIVRNHGGFLKVESKPGKGTQFRVYLPAQLGAQLPAEPPPTEAPPEGRGETILVVDDEEGVRVLTKKVLEQHGYHVLLASEGSEAVVAYAQHATEIHAVLTDLMMPLMDGATLIRALKQIAPAVKILATTGVTESTHDAAALRLGAREVLRKPYSPHVLLSRLRAALDEPEDAK